MSSGKDTAGRREILLSVFADLARNRAYDSFDIGTIIRKAKIARSTFYYHFRHKDDLLLRNLEPMIECLADLGSCPEPSAQMQYWTEHVWKHRAQARRILDGRTGKKICTALSGKIQIRARLQHQPHMPLVADQIAAAQLALLASWISGRGSASPAQITLLLWKTMRQLT